MSASAQSCEEECGEVHCELSCQVSENFLMYDDKVRAD